MKRAVLIIFVLCLSLNANESKKGLNSYYKEYMNKYYNNNQDLEIVEEKQHNPEKQEEVEDLNEESKDVASEPNQEEKNSATETKDVNDEENISTNSSEIKSSNENTSRSFLDNFTVGLELGSATIEGNSTNSSFKTDGTFQGIKLGYFFTENIRAGFSWYNYNEDANIDISSYEFGVDYLFGSSNLKPFIGIGYVDLSYKESGLLSTGFTKDSITLSDSGIGYRLGGYYRFNDSLSFELGYKIFQIDAKDTINDATQTISIEMTDANAWFFGLDYHF